MKNILLSLPLLLLVGCSSCNKEPKPTYTYLTQEVKDWMYFKKGSYWIYRDPLTKKVDSVWVDTAYIEMKDYGPPSGRKEAYRIEERFCVNQKNTFDEYIYEYSSLINASATYPDNISYPNSAIVRRERMSRTGSRYGGFDVLYLPVIEGAGGGYLKKVHDSLEVGGKYYKNVAEFSTGHFVCKHYGIIRIAGSRQYFEGTPYDMDLQLVRYKIVQ